MVIGNKDKCWYCGVDTKTTKDHFYPKSKGGKLQVYSCKLCNNLKKDLTPDQWILKIQVMRVQGHHIYTYDELTRMINATRSLLLNCINNYKKL